MTENTMLLTIQDQNTHKEMINFKALPKDMRTQVLGLTGELQKAMQDFSMSGLRIGEILLKGKTLLEPLKCFVAWLNGIPGMSKATAYRMIDKYKVAQKTLPPAVRQYALSIGEDLVSGDEKNPFGKYAKAVEQVGEPPKPTGNKQKDDLEAIKWVNEVTTIQGQMFHKATRGKKSYDELVVAGVRALCTNFARVEPKQQITYVRDVIGYALANMSLPEMTFKPKTPSSKLTFNTKPVEKGRKKGTGKKDKK